MTTIIPLETGRHLAEQLSNGIEADLVFPELKRFPDGESYIRIPEVNDESYLIVQSLYQPQETHLFNMLNLARTLKRKGAKQIRAIAPYLCYARADREVIGGEAISIETVFTIAKSVGIDELITIDIHNPTVSKYCPHGLKLTNLLPTKSMTNFLCKYREIDEEWIVLAPDKGAKYRAKALAEELGIHYNYFLKKRDPRTGEVSLIGEAGLAPLKKNVVLVDDIMATGRSLLQVMNHLLMEGVQTVNVLVTHAFGTDAVDQMIEMGNGLVASTISVPSPISRIEIHEDIIRYLGE